MSTARSGFSPPRGPGAERVDVYSRGLTVSGQEVDGTAESLLDADVRCQIGTITSFGLESVFGPAVKRESAALFGRSPVIEAGYRLEMSNDSDKQWFVDRVERLPHEHDFDTQVAMLSVDLRTS